MQLSNPLYDRLKWFTLIFLPALAVLMAGLGDLFAWPYTEQSVSALNLITVFLGTLLQISNHHYRNGGGPNGTGLT
ncbi:holin [Aerococcaceae bacterium DSM 111020]|nr:holin [Aerococcaceae bacterium DSM 111020]